MGERKKKVAIVYDWIDKWGGVERVLLTLQEVFPQAIFYTSYLDPEKAIWAKNLKIKTSFIQRLPEFIKKSRIASFLFYPFAFESFDFREYDLVISVSSSFAKSIITQPKTLHVCYLLTPTRYLWVMPKDYGFTGFKEVLISPTLTYLKKWDYVAAQRSDRIISISETAKNRCKKYYKRESEIIYPPFDIEYWSKIKSQITNPKFQINSKFKMINDKFYLVVSRLEPYKKVELVLNCFKGLKFNLVIVGEGSEEAKLKKIAGKNVQFFKKLTDSELGYLYSKAQALIMPQEEDFGYVSLEAQFFDCPVIAYNKGGAKETIIERKTGIFFEKQTVKSLRDGLARFHTMSYNLKNNIRTFGIKNTEKFSKNIFIDKLEFLLSQT